MTDLIAIPRPIIKQVLETFEEVAQWESDGDSSHPASKAIELLRAALEPQVEQEPVELRHLRALNQELLEALEKISAIENQEYGADWEEIEEARDIADAAIAKATGETK